MNANRTDLHIITEKTPVGIRIAARVRAGMPYDPAHLTDREAATAWSNGWPTRMIDSGQFCSPKPPAEAVPARATVAWPRPFAFGLWARGR